MAKSGSGGGGLGFVVALLAMAIVLYLAAKNWSTLMPTAAQALAPGAAADQVNGWGQRKSGAAKRPSGQPPASQTSPLGLPDLNEMGDNTDQHLKDVQDATAKQD
jgi:hypothetical protein